MIVAAHSNQNRFVDQMLKTDAAPLHFRRPRVGHRRASLRFGTRSRKHLCAISTAWRGCLELLPVISSGKIDSRTSLSSCWSSTPIVVDWAYDFGLRAEASFGGEVARLGSARTQKDSGATREIS
jgi:hypothetical protein